MPVYEYCCEKCNREFEFLLRKAGGAAGIRCPGCGSGDVRRLFSMFGFKSGNGFRSSTGSGCADCRGGDCSTCR